jgi:hypothetical protein
MSRLKSCKKRGIEQPVGEDDTEAQKTALVLATPPRKPGTRVEMSALRSFTDIRWPKVAKPICPLCASADIRLLLSIIHSDVPSELISSWTSWISGNVQNHAV